MKLATISTALALLAATQACSLKACTESDGGGTCSDFKDQEDGGCHTVPGDAVLFSSWVWEGTDCGDSGKFLCAWQTGVCNGQNAYIRRVREVPASGSLNYPTFQPRSWKFMNSDFC